VPQIAQKARLRAGFDADIVMFDLNRVTDRATFETMNIPSEGVVHLLIAGQAVISDGVLDKAASPGRPIRRAPE
jgi:N-acyl-D-glutamate deacylase